MPIIHATTATDVGAPFAKISVDDEFNNIWCASYGQPNHQEVFQQGLDQGFIQVLGPWEQGVDG